MSRQKRGYILAKEVVQTVINAGSDGITARGVMDVIDSCNSIPTNPRYGCGATPLQT